MRVDLGVNKVIEADVETLKFLAMIASEASKSYKEQGNSMGESLANNMENNILNSISCENDFPIKVYITF